MRRLAKPFIVKPFILGVMFGIAPQLGLTQPKVVRENVVYRKLVTLFRSVHQRPQQAARGACADSHAAVELNAIHPTACTQLR